MFAIVALHLFSRLPRRPVRYALDSFYCKCSPIVHCISKASHKVSVVGTEVRSSRGGFTSQAASLLNGAHPQVQCSFLACISTRICADQRKVLMPLCAIPMGMQRSCELFLVEGRVDAADHHRLSQMKQHSTFL